MKKYLEKDYQKLIDKYDKKSEDYKQLKYKYQLLEHKYNTKEKQLDIALEQANLNAKKEYQPIINCKCQYIFVQKRENNFRKGYYSALGTSK